MSLKRLIDNDFIHDEEVHRISTERQPHINEKPSLTEQSHKDECDVNFILKDYYRTGLLKHAKEYQGRYDDISSVDFQEAQFLIAKASSMFYELPAQFRARFSENPAKFLQWAEDPLNKNELRELGVSRGIDGLDRKGQPVGEPSSPKAGAKDTPDPAPSSPATDE